MNGSKINREKYLSLILFNPGELSVDCRIGTGHPKFHGFTVLDVREPEFLVCVPPEENMSHGYARGCFCQQLQQST